MTRRSYSVVILILLALTVSSPAQTERPAPAKNTEELQSGSITGKVVNENGHPLAEAYVYCEVAGIQGRHTPTVTDRNGGFKLEGLTRGSSCRVVAILPAYIPEPREPENAPVPQYRIGDSVTLVMIKGGVITGTVTSANGEPIAGIAVAARLIRDRNGRRVPGSAAREVATDDRGVYRVYGLPGGIYIVSTNSTSDYSQTGVNAFANEAPTYAPSATRDTAAEINVRAGEEVGNVDIRHRGERGRSVSGTVAEMAGEESGSAVVLNSVAADQEWTTYASQQDNIAFAFHGIPEGDYYVTAMLNLKNGERALSESKLINLRGADVTGLEFTTQPLGSVNGEVVAEETKAAECTEKTPLRFTETSVSAWHKDNEANKNRPRFVWSMGAPATPNDKGTFKLRTLAPSQYYFQARVQATQWYLKSITMGSPKPVDVTRGWTNIKSGDQLSGLTVTFAQGAASLSGKLVLAEDQTRPEKMFVYLVPAEAERADEPLRFSGGPVMPDGTVALNNLAPGRYWVLAQAVLEDAAPLAKVRLPDATRLRATLRREAQAGKLEIELKPCQKVVEFAVTLK